MSYDILNSESMLRFIPQNWEKDITIMIPCYNEEGNIISTFNTLIPVLCQTLLSWEIIVIDDGSQDNSKELIQRYINAHADYCISLKVREKNSGLAHNYYDGAFLARGKYYKLVCGDDVESKETMVKIFNLYGKADIIMPYHIKSEGRSFFRKMLSRTYTFLVNFIGGHKIKYYNGCSLCLTYLVRRWHTGYNGFCFQADIITKAIEQGSSYLEIPIIAHERKSGISEALRLRNFLSTAHFFLDLIMRRGARTYFT